MDCTVFWLLTGVLAFLLVIVNIVRAAAGKGGGWRQLLFGSLLCGVLSQLSALQMIHSWARREVIDALLDVVPTLTAVCFWALCIGIALNLLALRLHLRAEKRGEANGES